MLTLITRLICQNGQDPQTLKESIAISIGQRPMKLNDKTNGALKERQTSEEFTVIGIENVLLKNK